MKFKKRKILQEVVELNITTFMNLMVILIPFLLITAVFSRMTVIELTLPTLDSLKNSNEPVDLSLELVVRNDFFIVQDKNLGTIKDIPRNDTKKDWDDLTNILLEIKNRFPNETDIMLLIEEDITYETIIQVMDHVKFTQIVEFTELVSIELFPSISISDAQSLNIDNKNYPEQLGNIK
jgi:biopolymer transport protein ExbD